MDAYIYRLNKPETSVTGLFFPEVPRLFDEDKLDISQVVEISLITESYVSRRMICGLSINVLNKTFYTLRREITGYGGDDEEYVEKPRYALLSKKERAHFPSDDEFSERLTERPVY